jgi:hypothetical protein
VQIAENIGYSILLATFDGLACDSVDASATISYEKVKILWLRLFAKNFG